ncbi:MAG: T9SS type A sorting domain-containing protein [Bacteroidetes bacterium]|nr:T9SS type A sorting domain-containing protein [Bacteroidota bacterium]
MKMHHFTLFVVLFFLLGNTCIPQDFWEIVPTPDTANPWTITIHKNGDIFSGSNGVYLSHDQGETWEFKGLFGKTIGAIAIDSLDNVFAGTGSKMYKSTDYGESWYQVNYTLGNNTPIEAGPNGLMFAGGGINIGYLLRSFDYGESWDTVYIFSAGYYETIEDIMISPSGTVYFGTTPLGGVGGGVYRSIDHGENWEHIGLLYHYIQALALNSSGELFAASYSQYYTLIGGCYKYDEINSNWISLTENLNAKGLIINSNDDIYLGVSNEVGGPGGVYRSQDGGETWQWINSGLSANSIIGMWLSPDEYAYALTYASHTLNRSINPTVTVIDEDINTFKVEAFPNPSSENIYFRIALDVPVFKGSLMIFDIKGDILIKMDLKNTHNFQFITINTKEWSPGTYCYSIILNNYSQSGKILKIN